MALDSTKIKQLRTIGHRLKPVVTISGSGLSEGVIAELNRALDDHELIKIKLSVEDREDKSSVLDELIKTSNIDVVQQIGKVALIYRLAKKTNKKLSNLHRLV